MPVRFTIDLLTGNLVMVTEPSSIPGNALLLEDGTPILLEDGTYLLME